MSDTKTNETAASAATDERDNGMTKYPIYAVTVERSNNSKIVAEVPEYEIPILELMHGEVNVEKGEEIYEDERPSDAATILEALKRKYNNQITGDVVTPVYRNAEELGKAAGIKAGKAKKQAESLQLDNRRKSASGKK